MAIRKLEAGGKAPDFRLETTTGGRLGLAEILASGPALFVFYKVTCPTCQLALPYLQKLEGGSFQIFAICQNGVEQSREFDAAFDVHLATMLDKAEEGYPASNAFGITHVPSLFLAETDGTVSAVGVGFDKSLFEKLAARAGKPIFRPDDRAPAYQPG